MAHLLEGKTFTSIRAYERIFGFNFKTSNDYWSGTGTIYLCTKQIVKVPSHLREVNQEFLDSFCDEIITEVLEYNQQILYINQKLFHLPRESKFIFTQDVSLASKYDANHI